MEATDCGDCRHSCSWCVAVSASARLNIQYFCHPHSPAWRPSQGPRRTHAHAHSAAGTRMGTHTNTPYAMRLTWHGILTHTLSPLPQLPWAPWSSTFCMTRHPAPCTVASSGPRWAYSLLTCKEQGGAGSSSPFPTPSAEEEEEQQPSSLFAGPQAHGLQRPGRPLC